MSTQFRPMQPAQTGPGPQGGQPLHPTASYGQPGGEPARVINTVSPQYQSQYQQPQPSMGGYGAAGYDVANLPPAPTPQYGVPVGQPVQPQGYVPQGYAPAGYQPAPAQGGYQQPAAQPGYGYQPGVPTGQPAGAPRQGPGVAYLDPDAILDGPAIPAELRGRKVSQAFGIYGALAKDWLNREDQRRTGGAVNVQGQPQGGQQQPQQYGQPQQQQPQGGYAPQAPGQQPRPQWADQIRDIVREVVDQRMAPVIQTSQRSALQEAREVAARGIPDFQELEGDIMQMVAGANPQALADPGLWESAADLARGRRGRRTIQAAREQTQGQNTVRGQDGRLYSQLSTGQWVPLPPQMQQPQQPQQQNGYQGQPVYAAQYQNQPQPQYAPGYGAVPAQQSVLPQYAFFSEGPNAPSIQPGTLGLISPRERGYAQKMDMSDEDYIAWRGGVVR